MYTTVPAVSTRHANCMTKILMKGRERRSAELFVIRARWGEAVETRKGEKRKREQKEKNTILAGMSITRIRVQISARSPMNKRIETD